MVRPSRLACWPSWSEYYCIVNTTPEAVVSQSAQKEENLFPPMAGKELVLNETLIWQNNENDSLTNCRLANGFSD
jgi:hypothetical protein